MKIPKDLTNEKKKTGKGTLSGASPENNIKRYMYICLGVGHWEPLSNSHGEREQIART